MKKSITLSIVFICLNILSIFSQSIIKEGDDLSPKDFLKERVFVHFNSSFLVSGENLYYKIYCLNAKTNSLSNHSKIAYLELINTNKQAVFRHKISLKSGQGKGDFFINASIPSGNYKLIAYTQWMRNEGISTFFKNDITVINPYRANKTINAKPSNSSDSLENSSQVTKENKHEKSQNTPNKSEFLELTLNKQSFHKREKAILNLQSLKGKMSYGDYSISVRQVDTIDIPERLNSNTFIGQNHLNTISKDSISFLPELRGALLSGKVLLKKNNMPISNIKVGLSIPGKNFTFKIATTNESGTFYFNVDKAYESLDAVVQVVHSERDAYKIELNNHKSPDYRDLTFNDFRLTSSLKDLILKKSISNQIENAYYTIKSDSVEALELANPLYKSKEKKYFLEDYTRFKTLRETITEVVDAVYMLQKKGAYTFHVKFYNGIINTNLLPLVLIDGVLIQNHNDIISYNAKNVKSIGVVRSKYVYGGQLFMGIISIETLTGNYNHASNESYIKQVKLDNPQVPKRYFKQEYKNKLNLSRIPDFRSQLLWHPDFSMDTDEQQISFYTSDNSGDYEICVEGFTHNGNPVSLKHFISVINE